MKRLILLFSIFLLISCGSRLDHVDRQLTQLKSPVVLIAKHRYIMYEQERWSIVVKDSIGTIVSFSGDYYLARAIGDSFNVGDTIK